MPELMAERCFELKEAGKDDAVVRVGLTVPICDSVSGLWQCSVQVELPHESMSIIAQGSEPLEAVVCACKLAYTEIGILKSRFGESITLDQHQELEVGLRHAIGKI